MARRPRVRGGSSGCWFADVVVVVVVVAAFLVASASASVVDSFDRDRFLSPLVLVPVAAGDGSDAATPAEVVVELVALSLSLDFFLRRVGNRSALASAMGILSAMLRHSTDDSRVLALSLSLGSGS